MRQWKRDANRRRDLTLKFRHRDKGCRWNRQKDNRKLRNAPEE